MSPLSTESATDPGEVASTGMSTCSWPARISVGSRCGFPIVGTGSATSPQVAELVTSAWPGADAKCSTVLVEETSTATRSLRTPVPFRKP